MVRYPLHPWLKYPDRQFTDIRGEAMKFSTITVMFLALALSSTAHAGLVITMQDGQKMYFKKKGLAIEENGQTDWLRDGDNCTLFDHKHEQSTTGKCKLMGDEFRRMLDDMMKKHGMTQANMMGIMPEGSSQVRKIGTKVVAKYNTVCYEAGQWGEIIACFSPKVHNLIKATVGVDPQAWMKDFQMDKMPGKNLTEQALDKLQRNAFLMFRANYLSASGLNPFFVSNMPDAKVKQMVKDAKARGEPPTEVNVVAIETKSMNINRHSSYKKVPLREFIAGGMGGSSGDDMSTPGMPAMTGGDLNLEELMQQLGAADIQATPTTKKKKQKDKKKKLTFKERMKLLKDKAKAKLKNTEE